jgi:hypothetical protein
LQLRVPTWHESNDLAERLSSRWRSYGRLWVEPAISEPLIFTVTKDHVITDCP